MLFFLFAVFSLAYSRMYCGLDPMTNFLMEVQVKLDCRPIFPQHNECCLEHGFCYLRRKPYEECDNAYCSCIAPLSTEGVCKFHAENYCNNVKANGKNIYPMFTMQNGK